MTSAARDHSLPLAAGRLIELLRDERRLPPEHEPQLAKIAGALESLFHHELLAVRQRLRRAWDGLQTGDGAATASTDEQIELARDLLQTLRRLLRRANFVEVSADELTDALRRRSSFGLKIELDLADFEHLQAWRRRVVRRSQLVPALFGLKRRRVEVEAYDRFCLFARFKGAAHLDAARGRAEKLGIPPGGVTLRLFQNVPRLDVEALFPGVRVRMRPFDRALLGVPAVAGLLHFLVFKIGASLGAVVLALLVFLGIRKGEPELGAKALGACASLAVLLAFLFRQWMRFLGRKNLLHRQLAEHLQACTLDSGLGVLLHLLDEAAEEETAEALLAYVFLVESGCPLAAKELDQQVEEWLARRAGIEIDFEEEDALDKLRRFGLVADAGEGRLSAAPPERALAQLQARWNELLRHG